MKKAFTLVELLVVMAILGVLVYLAASNFRNAQLRGRDAQRKSDLKQIANALELYYSDYGTYPAENAGKIVSCPYNPSDPPSSSACDWGFGVIEEFTDNKTVYFKVLPQDPSKDLLYLYKADSSTNNSKYQLFAHLENTEDQDCIDGNCVNPVTYPCGTGSTCNFAVTSANTRATDIY